MLGLPAYAHIFPVTTFAANGADGASSPIYQTSKGSEDDYNYADLVSKGVPISSIKANL